MTRIVVTGAGGPVGAALCRLLASEDGVEVVAIDRARVPAVAGVQFEQAELTRDAIDGLFVGADAVCHLAGTDPLDDDVDVDVHKTERVLASAAAAAVPQVVVRSTAAVYGAWEQNPVPLTEAEPLRPNPDAAWVQVRADIEALVDAHRRRHGQRVAVLRPVVTVSDAGPDEFGRVLAAARVYGLGETSVPVQFVHADDVAAAVWIAVQRQLDGAYNVAPEGWLDTDMIRALVGGSPRVRMPARLARTLERVGYESGVSTMPPGYLELASQPWVVASDRLRAAGWEPSHTNEEAFVAGHRAAPWASISPRRRQELALGVTGAALVGGLAAGAAVLRSRFRS